MCVEWRWLEVAGAAGMARQGLVRPGLGWGGQAGMDWKAGESCEVERTGRMGSARTGMDSIGEDGIGRKGEDRNCEGRNGEDRQERR